MDLEKLQNDVKDSYSKRFKTIQTRVANVINDLKGDSDVDFEDLNLHSLKAIADGVLEVETKQLRDELEKLQDEKEKIERKLEKKYEDLQQSKYEIFNALEEALLDNPDARLKLHQVKLQAIDLFDMLSDMVESVIITALEKDKNGDVTEATTEAIKEITYEAIEEGSLSTIRIRKILSTILRSSIEVSEATPTKANQILHSTLNGMRSGLHKSIDSFKQRIEYVPAEAKHLLIEDYDAVIEDLNQTDALFSQVVKLQASKSERYVQELLLNANKDMRYDLEELLRLSKETADATKEKFSDLAKKAAENADKALNSQKALEAKRMGVQAIEVAKTAIEGAIKSARDVIDKK